MDEVKAKNNNSAFFYSGKRIALSAQFFNRSILCHIRFYIPAQNHDHGLRIRISYSDKTLFFIMAS